MTTTRPDRSVVRLRLGLLAFSLALLVPFIVLALHTGSQLRFETFFEFRDRAQLLAASIDRGLAERARELEALDVDEFDFYRDAGDGQVLLRSQLSESPPGVRLPGLRGYFQLSENSFSTPLVPPADTPLARTGLSADELARRQQLAESLRRALTLPVAATSARPTADETEAAPSAAAGSAESVVADAVEQTLGPRRQAALAEPAGDREGAAAYALEQFSDAAESDASASPEAASRRTNVNSLGKLGELRLDEELQQKSVAEEASRNRPAAPARAERMPPASSAPAADDDLASRAVTGGTSLAALTGNVSPFRFTVLPSGGAALYRDVWTGGQRRVQGALLDLDTFIDDTIASAFLSSSLAAATTLVIGYHDNVLRILDRRNERSYRVSADDLTGELLHKAQLSPPFDSLQLVLSAPDLPPGAGRNLLGWTAIAFAAVVIGGTLFMYRAGMRQIRLARQQQEFVSAVSHELKTPLTSIRMYGEMLKSGWADERKRSQYYDYIHDESERLTRLIDNVLQLSRISRGAPAPDARDVSGAELADLVRSKVVDRIERAGFEPHISIDADAAAAVVSIEPDGFVQVAINLVDNAIKFSRDANHRRIDIDFAIAGDRRLAIRVRDYGPGVPPALSERIFELFYRPDASATRETQGTGIGLAIVRMLVENMNGTVTVANREPGAEFTILLPLRG